MMRWASTAPTQLELGHLPILGLPELLIDHIDPLQEALHRREQLILQPNGAATGRPHRVEPLPAAEHEGGRRGGHDWEQLAVELRSWEPTGARPMSATVTHQNQQHGQLWGDGFISCGHQSGVRSEGIALPATGLL